ncbi:hypothetical protein EVA_17156 [gut metagenome]|uniref:Uncharacterized protein n=1 Tax=gut metagenome TaxID=749906 RepID=J9FYW2_9ZZZZ
MPAPTIIFLTKNYILLFSKLYTTFFRTLYYFFSKNKSYDD